MNICQIERYYGHDAAQWVRERIQNGEFKAPAVVCRLRNPKCKRLFLTLRDVVELPYPEGPAKLPDNVRPFDTVRIEIEEIEADGGTNNHGS